MPPEEKVWPVVDEAKDVVKWGARAPDAQQDSTSQEVTRSDRPQPVKPTHSDSSLVLLDIDGGTRAIRRNDPRSPEEKTPTTGEAVIVRLQSLTLSGPSILLWALVVCLSLPGPIRAQATEPRRPGRIFAESVFSIDEILSRPFDREVPMGCTGDRVWASSPQGWAFRDDVQWLYLTNLARFRPRVA